MKILSIDVGIKNLAFCILEDQQKILHWEVNQIPSEHSDGLYHTLKKHFDEKHETHSVDIVLIERQPDRNRKMKSVENFIHAYFICRDMKTIIWDAKHKIPDVVGPGKKKYKQRKDTSIQRCLEWIKTTNEEWVHFFQTHQKKDDLADTVMQALSYKEKTKEKKSIKPRKPTEHQTETKYSKSNLLWLYKNQKHIGNKRFEKDLKRYYKNIEQLIDECEDC